MPYKPPDDDKPSTVVEETQRIRPSERVKRAATATERDMESLAAKRSRDAATPEYVSDEITGNYEGEDLAELRRARASKDPVAAIVRLEEKHDDLTSDMREMREETKATRADLANTRLALANTDTKLGEVSGKLQVIPDLVSVLRESTARRDSLDHAKVTTTLDVDKAKQLGALKVAEATEIDAIKARADRRKFAIRLTALIAPLAAGLWELVKLLAGHIH